MEWPTLPLHLSAVQIAALSISAIVIVNTLRRFTRDRIDREGYPLPPAPTPLPLLGSVLSVNTQEPWLTYSAWGEKYGDVVYVRLLDSDVIVLNSYSDAIELLEKRSHMYSDRPFIATVEPFGHGDNIAFAPYGPHWRLARRIIHQSFRAQAALAFRPMQLRRARHLITNIIDHPKEYPFHYATFAAAVAMSAVYDYEPRTREDPMVKVVDDFCHVSFPALTTEKSFLLRVFPFLLNVPEWIPGLSRTRREANKAQALANQVLEMPYQWVLKRMEAKENIVANTMVFDHVHRMEKLDPSQRAEYEKALKQAAVTSFFGAAETTSSTLLTFTLAMIKNPRIWKQAQAEIDTVVGTDRLPDYDDRSSLPYVDAIVRETARWKPVVPMSVPHAAISNDIFKGYYIPSGATIFTNVWAMSRDESRYPDPETFIPERFLDSEGALIKDHPADFIFGFGRRICPGRYTSDASVWIGVATMLATLDFNAAKDENGNDIEFEARFATGLTHHPIPFPCNLVPRAHITKESLEHSFAK